MIFREYFDFIKHPQFDLTKNELFVNKIKVFILIYLLTLVLIKLVTSIQILLNNFGISFEIQNRIMSQSITDLNRYNIIIKYVIILFFTPIIEEVAFRLFLTKFKLKFFNLSISFIVSSIVYTLLFKYTWQSNSINLNSILPYIYITFLAFLFYMWIFVLLQKKEIINNISKFWNDKFAYFFYISCFVFSIIHLPVLEYKLNHLILIPLLLLPYFIYAISLGFIRIKLGFAFAMVFHFALLFPSILRKILTYY